MTSSTERQPLYVLMMPDYRLDNPYQTLLAQALSQEQVEVKFPVGYRRIFPIFRAIKDSSEPIDILHFHWLSPYLKGDHWFIRFIYCIKFCLDILCTRLRGVKVVWTIHNDVSHDTQFAWLEHATQWALAKLSNRLIVHHASTVPKISRLYSIDASKFEVIPHGHYRDIYRSAIPSNDARQILGVPETGRIYLNLGMVRPYKGIERLLNIWQEHSEFLEDSILLIAGQVTDEAYGLSLQQQASNIKNILLHLRFVESEKIHLYFSAADVVVLPFKHVLTSGSLILAMSYNKPIIAPNIPSIIETIDGANSLLYDPDDELALLHSLKESMRTDLQELKTLINKACDRLDWQRIGMTTCQLYRTIL